VATGANARAGYRYGVTPLSLACRNGNAEVVRFLLEAGVTPPKPTPLPAPKSGYGDKRK
jgi:ankyrin repeat protein